MGEQDRIEPFKIAVSEDALVDLRARLTAARLPVPIADAGWRYGMDVGCLRDLIGYWAEGYDWRRAEAELNTLKHFRTTIEGHSIHFVHLLSPHPAAMPLMIVHGWPGSIVEFLDIAERLTTPEKFGGNVADAFHLILPSLPGFGLSEQPREPGWTVARTARVFAELMRRLGYARYGVQGGDFGALVIAEMGLQDNGALIGLHTNMPLAAPPATPIPLSPAEEADVADMAHFRDNERGYAFVQSTKPDTIGVALTDSPAALCAWITEKFHGWTDHADADFTAVDQDRLLTNISLYWLTATGASAARFYYEYFNDLEIWRKGPIVVPTAVARFPKEMNRPPRAWVERQYNIVRWTQFDRGGHFAAMEVPDLLADDVLAFFRDLRSRGI